MWIFTRYGFYSIACATTPDGALDPEDVMIRARLRDHLCGLQERFPDLASTEIMTTPSRDYRYRLIVPKRVWASILYELSLEQQWSNFKNEAQDYQGEDGATTSMRCTRFGRLCTTYNGKRDGSAPTDRTPVHQRL